MRRLVEGFERFRGTVFARKRKLYEELASRQQPRVLFITCADSRVVPDQILQTEPGEIFVTRNAGNLVPPYGSGDSGIVATIEYAVVALRVPNIILCGHSDCGAMRAVLEPDSVRDLPAVGRWLRHADRSKRAVDDGNRDSDGADRLKELIEANVVAQVENLVTHPFIAAGLEAGELAIYGWVYSIPTGEIAAYDGELRRFVRLGPDSIPEAMPRRRPR